MMPHVMPAIGASLSVSSSPSSIPVPETVVDDNVSDEQKSKSVDDDNDIDEQEREELLHQLGEQDAEWQQLSSLDEQHQRAIDRRARRAILAATKRETVEKRRANGRTAAKEAAPGDDKKASNTIFMQRLRREKAAAAAQLARDEEARVELLRLQARTKRRSERLAQVERQRFHQLENDGAAALAVKKAAAHAEERRLRDEALHERRLAEKLAKQTAAENRQQEADSKAAQWQAGRANLQVWRSTQREEARVTEARRREREEHQKRLRRAAEVREQRRHWRERERSKAVDNALEGRLRQERYEQIRENEQRERSRRAEKFATVLAPVSLAAVVGRRSSAYGANVAAKAKGAKVASSEASSDAAATETSADVDVALVDVAEAAVAGSAEGAGAAGELETEVDDGKAPADTDTCDADGESAAADAADDTDADADADDDDDDGDDDADAGEGSGNAEVAADGGSVDDEMVAEVAPWATVAPVESVSVKLSSTEADALYRRVEKSIAGLFTPKFQPLWLRNAHDAAVAARPPTAPSADVIL
jgi:hypothetical protein